MELSTLFSAAGAVVLAGWLALAITPRHYAPVRLLVATVAVALAMLYVALIGAFWTEAEGGFGSLDDVAALFAHPGLLLAGWVHYLAFDLLVGLWEREEADRIGLSRWALLPCLLLTFLLGPAGWLAFIAMRYFHLQRGAAGGPVATAGGPVAERRTP
jgi:hypothetical protein